MKHLSQNTLDRMARGLDRRLLDPPPFPSERDTHIRTAANYARWQDTLRQQIAARWILFALFLTGCAFALRAGLHWLGLSN